MGKGPSWHPMPTIFMSHLVRFSALALIFNVGISVSAQEAVPFVFGETRTLRSVILEQERTINVYLPVGYSRDSTMTYPVIYVLDGSANEDFPHTAGLAQFMNMYQLLPPSIVVGIANVDRYHDFSHVTRNDSDRARLPTAGGSGPFIEFIARELQPFVDHHYKSSGVRTITGQSLGALLCTQILFERPELFDNYVIVSPSLWWDNGSLVAKADEWLKTNGALPKKIYLSIGAEPEEMQHGMDLLVAAFTAHARPPLQWIYVPFHGETHATVLHRSVYRAFEWLTTGK